MWCPGISNVIKTDNIFHKSKRIREEDEENEESIQVVLEMECSQTPLSFVLMVEQQTPTATYLFQMDMFVPGSQSSQEAKICENISVVQKSQTPEHVTWSAHNQETSWLQKIV
jgi:hypothetical protein